MTHTEYKTKTFLCASEGLRFQKRSASFSETTAVVSENDCGRFGKRLRSFLKTTALVFVLLGGNAEAQAQHSINFDRDWTIQQGGAERQVTLPRAWNGESAFRVLIDDLPTDTARYVKTFTLPRSDRGKRVLIEFEGARQLAKVWLNGHYLGMHENGVGPFGFDLTPYLKYGKENRLEVLTDNSWQYREAATGAGFQWNNKNFNANYGGLPKHVWLHVLSDVHQTLPLWSSFGTKGVYVWASDFNLSERSALVTVESEVENSGAKPQAATLLVEVIDADGRQVASFRSEEKTVGAGQKVTFSAAQRLHGLRLWTWREGNLYRVKTQVEVKGRVSDEVVTATGFRHTEFRDGMIFLNGQVMMVHGFAQRTSNEWPGVGMSVPAWLSDYSNALMTACGGNLVRWMHVAPWRQDVESCDRVGLPQAMPAGDAEADAKGRQWEQRVELMRDVMLYYRNNPSVIFYECGNKGISEEHMKEMLALRDELDPHGGRAIGSREMLASTTAEYGGEMLYINKSARKPVWAMEYCRDEGLRRYWDDWSYPYHKQGDGPLYRNADASAYNQNQDQLAVEHIRRWYDYWMVRPGTGKRVSSGGVKIIFSDTNTHCRGESNYRTSGLTDAMRLPKDSYWTHLAMWDGWVTPQRSHTYIMGHWNYPEGTVKPVYVVSDADRVTLSVNGKTYVESSVQYHFLHVFDSVRFENGAIEAVSYGQNGTELSRCRKETVGEPVQLRMESLTSPQGFVADGADMALLTFEVVDAQGRRCPLDNRSVRFTLEGPAEWIGGIGKGEGNCVGSKELPVECGVNRALVRSTTQTGAIRVVAEAQGLPAAVCTLQTVAEPDLTQPLQTVSVSPMPAQPLQVTMAAVVPEAVTAGCNGETAQSAIDDNEETEWHNDGKSETAWIAFHFAEPQHIDCLDLKLTGWRRRSYPLEILADGRCVWQGSTPLSLGYVRLPLSMDAGQTAKTFTIRLRGTATEGDAFSQVTELVQPTANELDLYKAKDGDKVRSELRIIECDFLRKK